MTEVVNSINGYGNFSASNTGVSSKVQNIIDEHNENKSKKEGKAAEIKNSDVFLSSRAQRISLLNTEFFRGGSLTNTDVNKLVERVYEFGLISKEDYSRLSGKSLDQQPSAKTETTKLVDFIDGFSARLKKSEKDDKSKDNDKQDKAGSKTVEKLTEALQQAKVILTDVEQAKKQDNFKNLINQSITTLREVIDSSAFNKIPIDDRASLTNLGRSLEVIDKLSPQRLTNEKVNRYLDISLS